MTKSDYTIYRRWIIGMVLIICCTTAAADTLVIPDISSQPLNKRDNVQRPVRSMTMEQVKAEYGEPSEVISAVGDPPITRWIYDKFVVHFEHNYVIHSVVKK